MHGMGIIVVGEDEDDGEEVWGMGYQGYQWEWIGRWSRCTCCGTKPYSGSGTAKFQYKNIPMPSLWWNGWLVFCNHIPNAAIDLQLLIYWSINQVHVCLLYFVYLAVLGRCDFHLWYANLMPCFLLLYTWWEVMMRKSFNTIMSFNKYPVCSKVYTSFECCIEKVGSKQSSKTCSYIVPHARQHFWNL